MDINQLKEQKAALRQQLKKRRESLDQAYITQASAQITESLLSMGEISAARQLFVYLSFRNEVDTRPLLDALLQAGKRLAVPKILSKTEMIAVQFTGWENLKTAELGILTPTVADPLPGPFDICITPGLGFAEDGSRIGFGAGYYDRWFANNPVQKKIGIAYQCQIEPHLPRDEYDQLMNTIVTDQQVIEINEGETSPTA